MELESLGKNVPCYDAISSCFVTVVLILIAIADKYNDNNRTLF